MNNNNTFLGNSLTSLTSGARPVPKSPLDFAGKKAQRQWDAKASHADAFATTVVASVAGTLVATAGTAAVNLAASGIRCAINKVRVSRAQKQQQQNQQGQQQQQQ